MRFETPLKDQIDGADRWSIATTGQRPEKLGGHGEDTFAHVVNFAADNLKMIGANHVISGASWGWEIAV